MEALKCLDLTFEKVCPQSHLGQYSMVNSGEKKIKGKSCYGFCVYFTWMFSVGFSFGFVCLLDFLLLSFMITI